jgi:hypothetical protein
MASRRVKYKINTNKKNGGGRNSPLPIELLLEYLVTPLPMTAFDISSYTFQHDIVDSIQRLLIKAIQKILPDKVLGIQFIFAKRPTKSKENHEVKVEGDFTFPLLLHCRNIEEALGIADGMAHVTKLLLNQKSSFHVRVRSNRLTYSPAVCVFSRHESDHVDVEYGSTTVLWVNLNDDSNELVKIRFPRQHIENIGIRAPEDKRLFYQADLKGVIDEGLYDEDAGIPSLNLRRIRASASVELVHTSDITDDYRNVRLQKLRHQLGSDTEYLRRVSYLLKFGDVILCTPHAYHDDKADQQDNPISPHETITDSGLTVILDREKGKITEDDWVRIQVVAQKLAIFAGAAVSTAVEARESIVRLLHRGFDHEFRNAVVDVKGRLKALTDGEGQKLLSSEDYNDIDGRLQFTKLYLVSVMEVFKQEFGNINKILEGLIKEMAKYKDVLVQTDLRLTGSEVIMGLWRPVLIEVLRNSYKHSVASEVPGKKIISVTAHVENHHCVVVISNTVDDDKYKREVELGVILDPEDKSMGWQLALEMTAYLKGRCRPRVVGDEVSIAVHMPLVGSTGDLHV